MNDILKPQLIQYPDIPDELKEELYQDLVATAVAWAKRHNCGGLINPEWNIYTELDKAVFDYKAGSK